MVYAKTFNGRDGVVFRKDGIPLQGPYPPSTRVLFIHDIEHRVVTSALGQPNRLISKILSLKWFAVLC